MAWKGETTCRVFALCEKAYRGVSGVGRFVRTQTPPMSKRSTNGRFRVVGGIGIAEPKSIKVLLSLFHCGRLISWTTSSS